VTYCTNVKVHKKGAKIQENWRENSRKKWRENSRKKWRENSRKKWRENSRKKRRENSRKKMARKFQTLKIPGFERRI
jgi:hypothetical protein